MMLIDARGRRLEAVWLYTRAWPGGVEHLAVIGSDRLLCGREKQDRHPRFFGRSRSCRSCLRGLGKDEGEQAKECP